MVLAPWFHLVLFRLGKDGAAYSFKGLGVSFQASPFYWIGAEKKGSHSSSKIFHRVVITGASNSSISVNLFERTLNWSAPHRAKIALHSLFVFNQSSPQVYRASHAQALQALFCRSKSLIFNYDVGTVESFYLETASGERDFETRCL